MMKGDGENFIRFQMTGRDWHKDVQSTKLGVSGPLLVSGSSSLIHFKHFSAQTGFWNTNTRASFIRLEEEKKLRVVVLAGPKWSELESAAKKSSQWA